MAWATRLARRSGNAEKLTQGHVLCVFGGPHLHVVTRDVLPPHVCVAARVPLRSRSSQS